MEKAAIASACCVHLIVDVYAMSTDLTTYKYSSSGFGLACHIGVLANLPTIGVGKNVSLIFTFL
jgi:Endonuclease V